VFTCGIFCKVQQYIIIRILIWKFKGTIWDLHPSGMLHSTDWQLVTDVLGQHISSIFKGYSVQEEFILLFYSAFLFHSCWCLYFCRPSWCQTPQITTSKSLCLLILTRNIEHSQVLNTILLCNSLPPYVWREALFTTSDFMGHYYVFLWEIVALELQVGYEWEPSFSMHTFPSVTVYVATVWQHVLLLWSLLSPYSPP